MRGHPFWTGTLAVNGEGSYVTAPVLLAALAATRSARAIAESGPSPRSDGLRRGERDVVRRAAPKVTTLVANAVVKPRDQLFDRWA